MRDYRLHFPEMADLRAVRVAISISLPLVLMMAATQVEYRANTLEYQGGRAAPLGLPVVFAPRNL